MYCSHLDPCIGPNRGSCMFHNHLDLDARHNRGSRTFKKEFSAHLDTGQLRDVLQVLKEVVKWRDLFLLLGMPKHVADRIGFDYRGDVTRQKEDAFDWWLRNCTASWKELADALLKADNRVLAEQLYEGIFNILVNFGVAFFLCHVDYAEEAQSNKGSFGGYFRMWKITRDFTIKMAEKAFENIFKKPVNFLLQRVFKTRGKGDEKQARWWIDVKGDEGELKMFGNKQSEIEQRLGCHIEVKAC